jgi:hypothetical protein
MNSQNALAAIAGTIQLLVILAGASIFLLQLDWPRSHTDAARIDCTHSTSSLCSLHNFLNAQSSQSEDERECRRHGLPANCAN